MQDLSLCPTRLPDVVHIVGSGPNAIETPKDAYVMALNRAASKGSDIWVVADHVATQRQYFKGIYDNYKGIKIFSTDVILFGRVVADYTFLMMSPHPGAPYEYIEHADRIGSSVAGSALWIAHKLGAKEVIFNGIDMGGDKDFTGEDLVADKEHGEVWRHRDNLDSEIEYFRSESGMKISSISKTQLRSV